MIETVEKIQASLDTIEGQNKELLANNDRLEKENKRILEDVTMLKNSNADQAIILRQLQRLKAGLQNEREAAWGDPVKNFARDTEKASLMMAGFAKMFGVLPQCSKFIQDIAKKDLDSANTPGSTYIANAELDRGIYDLLLKYGAFRNLDVRTVGTKSIEIRVKTAKAAASFVDEADPIGADATKAGSKTSLTPKKIGTLISAANELMEDDVSNMVEDILRDLVESWQEKLDWISFTANGDADATDGGFTGIFYGGTSRVAVSGNVSVATLDYEDVLACLINAPASVLERPSKWFIHPSMLARLMTIKDGSGRPLFQTALEAPSYGSLGSILGYGVIPVGNAPNTDGTSKKIAAFGDPFGQAVRIRRDLTVDMSKDFAFGTDEVTFRSTGRAGSLTKAATAFQILTTAAS